MQNQVSSRVRLFAAIFCLIALAGSTYNVNGQSGRRIPKKPPEDREPAPPPKDETTDKTSSSQPNANAIPVLIASDLYDFSSNTSILTRVVEEGMMDRLREVRSVRASLGGNNTNRKQASDAAKNSTDTYVLWFQLRGESGDPTRPSPYQELYVDYVIFSPGTGKQKTSGHVYQRQRGGVGGVPFPPTTTAGTVEYTLRAAGHETADRLLDALGMQMPGQIPH